jgi:hypothetical protein
MVLMEVGIMARWTKGERAVEYLVGRGCLESFSAERPG